MRKASETEKKNREQLFKLMREYPDLPVIPMVSYEVVADDDCPYWKGSWGSAKLGAYIVGYMRIYFREDDADDMEDVLNHTTTGRDWYDAPEDEVTSAYQNLPWTECIVAYIDLPEVE